MEVLSGNTLAFDLEVRGRVHEIAHPLLTFALTGITLFGSTGWIISTATLAVFVQFQSGFRREAIVLAFVMAGAFLFNYELKMLVGRQRPAPLT